MASYFYSRDGQQYGPMTADQLKQCAASGQLRVEDLVWKEGAPSWVPASSVKGLFPVMAQPLSPPPIPPSALSSASPATVSSSSPQLSKVLPVTKPSTGSGLEKFKPFIDALKRTYEILKDLAHKPDPNGPPESASKKFARSVLGFFVLFALCAGLGVIGELVSDGPTIEIDGDTAIITYNANEYSEAWLAGYETREVVWHSIARNENVKTLKIEVYHVTPERTDKYGNVIQKRGVALIGRIIVNDDQLKELRKYKDNSSYGSDWDDDYEDAMGLAGVSLVSLRKVAELVQSLKRGDPIKPERSRPFPSNTRFVVYRVEPSPLSENSEGKKPVLRRVAPRQQ